MHPLVSVHALGLDPIYEDDAKRTLVQDVKPPGMSRSQFEKAIEGAGPNVNGAKSRR